MGAIEEGLEFSGGSFSGDAGDGREMARDEAGGKANLARCVEDPGFLEVPDGSIQMRVSTEAIPDRTDNLGLLFC